MKIIQTIKREETIEKEISLPYFCKIPDDNCYFKIIAEDKAMKVDVTPYWTAIILNTSPNSLIGDFSKTVECSEDEFNEACHKASFEHGKYVPAPDAPKDLLIPLGVTIEEFKKNSMF